MFLRRIKRIGTSENRISVPKRPDIKNISWPAAVKLVSGSTCRGLIKGGCAFALIATSAVASDDLKSFPEFEARRVKPPTKSTQQRITIQIEPAQNTPKPSPPSKEVTADTPEVESEYSWFWDQISPELAQSGPGRLSAALQVLSGSGKVAAPRLQALQDIAAARGISILLSTVDTQVSPALVLAVIAVESSGKADAVSSAGATGLMQLMPATAERFGVTDALVADDNIAGGVKYLDWLMQKFDRDPILVLAGYNAGAGAVRDHQGVPPYAETRDYVPKVLAAFQVAKGLCATPPELITDGCVFAPMK